MSEVQKKFKGLFKELRIKKGLCTALTLAGMWAMIWGLYRLGQYDGVEQVIRGTANKLGIEL